MLPARAMASLLGHVEPAPKDPIFGVTFPLSPPLRSPPLPCSGDRPIDIHCIKSHNELPESGVVAVLNEVLITGSDKCNKGEYFLSLIAKRKVEAFGAEQILQDTTSLSRNSEIQTKRYDIKITITHHPGSDNRF
ncbi:Heterogeneous nuclear ribonucleoprotein A1 [Hordeum vulgare]|nr:Heterogeneous nuclear ribonucleoprotein A1 [Hordeum vulgare]